MRHREPGYMQNKVGAVGFARNDRSAQAIAIVEAAHAGRITKPAARALLVSMLGVLSEEAERMVPDDAGEQVKVAVSLGSAEAFLEDAARRLGHVDVRFSGSRHMRGLKPWIAVLGDSGKKYGSTLHEALAELDARLDRQGR